MEQEQQQVLKNLETIMEGRLPDSPGQTFDTQLDALREASAQELEALLMDPSLHEPANSAIRDEVISLLAEHKSPNHVNQLLDMLAPEVAEMGKMASGEAGDRALPPAERARKALGEMNNPLADVIPDTVRHFLMDSDGTFYLELFEGEVFTMEDFDLVLDPIVTGVMEADRIHSLSGVHARKDVEMQTIEIQFLEFLMSGDMITAQTNHPKAPIVHLRREDFIMAMPAN